jgi:hypothetical protein
MTYTVNPKTFASWCGRKAVIIGNAVASELGILRRILGVIFESRETLADREIAPVAGLGGTCTDGTEREIMHRTSARNSTFVA